MNDCDWSSFDRVIAAFERKEPDRVPVMPFVLEWCARQVGYKVSELMTSVQKHVYSQIYCVKKFGYDVVYDLQAVHAESEAMGSILEIPEDDMPLVVKPAVQDYKRDLPKLKIPNPWKDGRLPLILKGIEMLKDACNNEIPVVGYVQGCWRHTCMLRGPEEALKDLIRNPDPLTELIEIATYSQIVYGSAVADAGADIIFVSDPFSSGDVISRKHFEEFVFPFLRQEIRAIKRKGIKVMLHICGDTSDRLDLMAATGADAISIEEKVDIGYAKKLVGDKVCIIGNVDPMTLLMKTPKEVEEECEMCIEKAARGGGFILASGCGVNIATPPENILAMVRVAKLKGRYKD